MPTYEYRCGECGIVERTHVMGAAPSTEACPGCGDSVVRVFSVPLLRRTPGPLASALEQAEASRHDPALARRGHEDSRTGRSKPLRGLERLVGKDAAQELRTARHRAEPVH